MTPGGGEQLPTQTVEKGTDQVAPTTPMIDAPGPEHNQQNTIPQPRDARETTDPAIETTTDEEKPERKGIYISRRVALLGVTATAVVAVAASAFVPRLFAGDPEGPAPAEPGVSGSLVPGPIESQPQPPASGLPMESTQPSVELAPLPPEAQKYFDTTEPYAEQVPGTETNLDVILAGLSKQRDIAINSNRLDILRAMYYSGSDFNPLRELDEKVMKLTKENTYLFDSEWKRADAVKATVPHPSDPTIGSMEVWKVTVQGTDLNRARKQGESYPMPRDYDMTFYLVQDTGHDADGNPTEKVWTIAGNYSGADFDEIKDVYAGEIR